MHTEESVTQGTFFSSDHLCNLYGPSVLLDPAVTKSELLQRAIEDEGYIASDPNEDDSEDYLSRRSSFRFRTNTLTNGTGPPGTPGSGQHGGEVSLGSPHRQPLSPPDYRPRSRSPSFVSVMLGPAAQDGLMRAASRNRRPSQHSTASGLMSAPSAIAAGGGGLRRQGSVRARRPTRQEDREVFRDAVRASAYNRVRSRDHSDPSFTPMSPCCSTIIG